MNDLLKSTYYLFEYNGSWRIYDSSHNCYLHKQDTEELARLFIYAWELAKKGTQ